MPAVRRKQEERKRNTEGQVAGTGPEADERKRKSGIGPGGEIRKGITCGTAAGVKQGRTKGNHQKAEYGNRERKHEKSGWE